MIITQQKDINEIYDMIKQYSKILIAGCDGCCQPPRSINEAKVLGQLLELKAKTEGKKLIWKATTVLRQCDDRIAATTIRPFIGEYEAIVSLACGLGVVMMNKVASEILTFPAQNSMFGGVQNNGENNFIEYCEECGDCIIGETGGICPRASCAKHLMNGPCGGTVDGKCEVGGYTIPCAWIEIYKRLKAVGRLDLFNVYRPARDYRTSTSPGYIKIFKEYTNEEETKEEAK
ncbi:MAG: methylenetetrahydrofolate reductase C-terminal domain-containing protein [Candidatus Lokiarchaeota archaeon]|nr:methylenetetrahydrofolate reductase C-terminal domain-containing protein [Candidatus Lokiarchaeota archaeon]